jgi:CheY-like chemotaxis protein
MAAKLILLVDDDFDYLEVNRLTLERAGYRVACADDAEQGMRKIGEERPDLIVSDLMMGALDEGFAFARALKADAETAGIPIILTTGIHRQLGVTFKPTSPAELAAMGVEAYLEKPVRGPLLLAKVAELLGGG